jgi:1-deoxy-D-xylulose-5-phosphate reductoisomerase
MDTTRKGIAILGSTGSIGTQALEVIAKFPNELNAVVLTANSNYELLIAQAKAFQPNAVVIADERHYQTVRDALWDDDIKVFAGAESLCQIVEMHEIDLVLTAMVGFCGLEPTLRAIQARKPIALANKETLVVAGELITSEARKFGVNIYPVDSEHSAIFQCLAGEFDNPIEKIMLTASGGPFRGWTQEKLKHVTVEQALAHPNWQMGSKITIDSATLMNKGLEVIEARWLFGLKPDQIEVLVHPQSVVHSMVQFQDGSIKAQIGLPDMKLPIQYAFTYPKRLVTPGPRLDFREFAQWNFEAPDTENFPNLQLAYQALEMGGTASCVLNAANEVAVELFLQKRIQFTEIAQINRRLLEEVISTNAPNLEELNAIDAETRRKAREFV